MIPFRSRVLRLLVCVIIGVTIWPLSATRSAQSAGQSQAALEAPPVQAPRVREYHVDHYRIETSIDLPNRSITGATAITLEPLKTDFHQIDLDAGDMKIKAVSLESGTPLQFKYSDGQKLAISLDHIYQTGQKLTVVVNYAASPRQGLTFISPNAAGPGRPYQVWSQGESQTNHYWFPCYDYPNDKATCETITTADDKYMVISNGKLVDVKDNTGAHTRTWHWQMDEPYSSYLTSIIVGQFAEIEDHFKKVPIISYVYPDQIANGRVSLGNIGRMVTFFSEKIGIDYPYTKYSETTVADFPGGMENISATTMTDTVIHDRRAQLDVSSDPLISHELAHQWFGDMLTCRDWGQLWLNESFAEFFADLWSEHDLGIDDYSYQMRANQLEYLEAWSHGIRRPLVTDRYDDPDALFDAYAYPRGAATVGMLRYVLGDDDFWKSIHHYAEKYKWQNVDTGELIQAIAEATGKNLQWFFDEWVYQMGHPVFDVSDSYDQSSGTLKLVVKQEQKPDQSRPWFRSTQYFTTPVDVAITTAAGERVERVVIDGPEKEFSFKVDSRPLIVNFDRGNHIIKQMKFKRPDDELIYQAAHDRDSTGRIRAIDELITHKSPAAEQALAEVALNDRFWGVRNEAITYLSGSKGDASKQTLIQATKDRDSRVRRAAVNGLAAYKDPGLGTLFVGLAKNDPSYFVVADAAAALGQSSAPGAYDVLAGLLSQSSWQDTIRGGALRGLAALKDPRAMELAFKYAAPGNQLGLRAVAMSLLAQNGKGNERVFDMLVAALKEPSEQVVLAALQGLGILGDPRAIPALQELEKRPDFPGEARQIVDQEIAKIRAANNGG